MRRSFGDALKNAFKETTMKNVPIDQFQSFKVNWSKVKVNSQSAHGSDPSGPGRVGPGQRSAR